MKDNSKFMWFIHHFVLILQTMIFTPIFFMISLLKLVKKDVREKVKKKKIIFYKKMDVFVFLFKLRRHFKYANDGFKKYWKWIPKWLQDLCNGLFNHYNTLLEIFVFGGDCSDFPRFAKGYLKKFYNINAVVYGIIGQNISTWHYDCYFYYNEQIIIVNQGNFQIVEKVLYDDQGNLDIEKSVKNFINTDKKYMSGWYRDYKHFWKCKW